MKFRLKPLLAVLAVMVCLAPLAMANQVYVRNRVFKEAVTIGGEVYVPVDSFLRTAGFSWQVRDGQVVVSDARGSSPDLTAPVTISYGGQTLDVQTSMRGQRVYAPLKPLARALGFDVNTNAATGIVDVVKGHGMTAAEKSAYEQVAKEKAEKEAALQAVLDARAKERAEKARAEEEARAAAEETSGEASGDEAAGKGDKTADKGDKTTDKGDKTADKGDKTTDKGDKTADKGDKTADKGDKTTAKGDKTTDKGDKTTAKGDKTTDKGDKTADKGDKTAAKGDKTADKGAKTDKAADVAAGTPTATPSASATPSTSPSPEKPKEALLVVQNESAQANDYTGEITVTAEVVNQGFATARNVSARYQLIGPDGKTWDSKTFYGPPIDADKSWNISHKYKHPAGSSMPRGSLTPKFQLDYKKN